MKFILGLIILGLTLNPHSSVAATRHTLILAKSETQKRYIRSVVNQIDNTMEFQVCDFNHRCRVIADVLIHNDRGSIALFDELFNQHLKKALDATGEEWFAHFITGVLGTLLAVASLSGGLRFGKNQPTLLKQALSVVGYSNLFLLPSIYLFYRSGKLSRTFNQLSEFPSIERIARDIPNLAPDLKLKYSVEAFELLIQVIEKSLEDMKQKNMVLHSA